MRQILLILLALMIFNDGKSCDCNVIRRDSAVSLGLRGADIVFYGERIHLDTINETYIFKIYELYKGDYKRDTIWGRFENGCSILPYDDGLWIVYANRLNDTTINMSMCGTSIPLKRAEGLVPPPPLFYNNNKAIDDLKLKVHILEKRSEGIALWFYDLEKLRLYKKSKEIIKPQIIDLKDILIGALILLNLTLIIIVVKTRKNLCQLPTACITNCLVGGLRFRIRIQNRNTRHSTPKVIVTGYVSAMKAQLVIHADVVHH
jgi:hypothetical protein